MRKKNDQIITGIKAAVPLMVFIGMMFSMAACAVDFQWTNVDGNNDYLNTNNWKYADNVVATNLPSAMETSQS